jgi:outer membrane protein OmpA-like peptidoglycan-associated protein
MLLAFSVYPVYAQQILSISGANSPFDDTNPVWIGSNTLLFTRAFHPQNLGGKSDQGDIWMIKKDTNGKWMEAVHRPDLSSKGYDLALGLEDLLTLLVLRKEKAEVSINQFSKFGQDWNFLRKINFPELAGLDGTITGRVAQGGNLIFIAGKNSGGYGNEDIYVSQKTGVIDWSPLHNLGNAVNGFSEETGPFFDPESKLLFFSSSSHLGATGKDILVAKKLGETWDSWSKPEKWEQISTQGSETSVTFISKGEIVWTSAQNSDGVEDLLTFAQSVPLSIPDDFKPFTESKSAPVIEILPNSTHKKPGEEITIKPSGIESIPSGEITTLDQPEIAVSWLVMDSNLKIEIPFDITWMKETIPADFPKESKLSELVRAGITTVKATSKGYFPVFLPINDLIKKGKTVVLMTKAETGRSIVVKDIQFKVGTSELEGEITFSMLSEIAEFLIEQPNLVIRINGHTDNVGDPSLSKELSLQRAASVRNFLISNGVNPEKLRVSGWGGTKPVASNATEAGRSKNRRVELSVEN